MTWHSNQPRFGVVAALAIACTAPAVAHAGPEDALNFVVGTSVTYDNNLFRLATGETVPVAGKTSRSDTIYKAYAGVRIDKAYSLQRFQLDLTGTRYQYQNYEFLNFSAIDYRGAWLWSLTPSLTGVVSAERTETPTNFADFNNPGRRNVQTLEIKRFAADWAASGAWHVVGGLYQTRLNNSGGFTEVGNYVQDTVEGGIKYVSAADNSLTLVQRESRGEYSGRNLGDGSLLDNRYNQSETELRSLWKVTGHSTLDTRIGYLDRTHENYGQRDYSGAVGRISYLWMPTGKLQFTLAAGRDLYSYQNNSSSYYVFDYVSLIPAWLITDKTTLRLKLDLGKRDYRGPVQPTSPTREDTLRGAQLSVAWRPTPTIDVGAHVTHEQRSSNIDQVEYRDNILGISAALKF